MSDCSCGALASLGGPGGGSGGGATRPGSCGCDPLTPPVPDVTNPPAQPALRWRSSPHSHALARLRAALADPGQPDAVRALAYADPDEPLVALLDAWAVIADTVSFYTERIAQEGFIRTATELTSVRQLARGIGYELRPGVAAQAEVAFTVETAPGAPASATIPLGTPVKSVPGPGQLPQTFETSADLTAYGVWNAIPIAPARLQHLGYGSDEVWLRGVGLGVNAGDGIVVVGAERLRFARTAPARRGQGLADRDDERWDFRVVLEVTEPAQAPGWTLLRLRERVGYRERQPLTAMAGVQVFLFRRRANLFGWTAPDPSLLKADGLPVTNGEWTGIGDPRAQGHEDVIELDTDLPSVLPGSWLLLERFDYRELYWVEEASPAGLTRFGVSGKATRVRVDFTENLTRFGRRETLVRADTVALPAADAPVLEPVGGTTLYLSATTPALSAGKLLVVAGFAPGTAPTDPIVRAATPPPQAEAVTVVAVTATDDPRVVRVDIDPPLRNSYDPQTTLVRANVVAATHGESVVQVLGSGDATIGFQRLATRRGPLTHLRADTASGASSTLRVTVDGVDWQPVESLDAADRDDRVYAARLDDAGLATVTTGDGSHGSRLPTGAENVAAGYRVGIGADGALNAGQLSLLPRRPLGISGAVNPAATHDWAAAEDVSSARTVAPQRIRTLDRAVSVADHEDFAAGYAGVGLARADAVWNGRGDVVVVTVLGTGGAAPATGLVNGLTSSLLAARHAGEPFVVLPGEVVGFAVRVGVRHDPLLPRADVEAAVRTTLESWYAPGARPFTEAVAAAALLVLIRSVPGVLACTMPTLRLAGVHHHRDILAALPARLTDAGTLAGAQELVLTGGVTLEVMA